MLTQKGREPFIRMRIFLDDEVDIHLWKKVQLSPPQISSWQLWIFRGLNYLSGKLTHFFHQNLDNSWKNFQTPLKIDLKMNVVIWAGSRSPIGGKSVQDRSWQTYEDRYQPWNRWADHDDGDDDNDDDDHVFHHHRHQEQGNGLNPTIMGDCCCSWQWKSNFVSNFPVNCILALGSD